MNIRKSIDYCEMLAALDHIIETEMSQMELYCEIGKAVCQRTEKGAAVAASEYLTKKYPDVQGFSPRNLRRMRNFYRTYEEHPDLLSMALQLGWTQNIVIMEADLSVELRKWYLKAAKQFVWSKGEPTERIAKNAHEVIPLAIDEEVCDIAEKEETICQNTVGSFYRIKDRAQRLIQKVKCRTKSKRKNRRRCTLYIRYSR